MRRLVDLAAVLAVAALVFAVLGRPIQPCFPGVAPAPQPDPSCVAAFPAWHDALPTFDRLAYDLGPAFPLILGLAVGVLVVVAGEFIARRIGSFRSRDIR